MNELYESVDYNNLKSEYAGPTKDVNFYEYMDSKCSQSNQKGLEFALKP